MGESSLSEKVALYIYGRSQVRLEKIDKEAEKELDKVRSQPAELVQAEVDLADRRQAEVDKFRPAAWLTEAAKRAGQISMVTHAIKYTHTDAKGTSIFAPLEADGSKPYLTTASLSEPETDVVGNAAALDVASLLLLSSDGQSLAERVANDDISALEPFAEDDQQLQEWLRGFKAALADRELSSHKLAKQLYFPVGDGGNYHLISPLYASSLSQALYRRIAESRFSETAKEARKARREGKYSDQEITDYPATAIQSFGGTKPQNVSQLNTMRRGKGFLLSCQPPKWETKFSPPTKYPDSFWREYQRQVRGVVSQLAQFLKSVADKDSNIRIRRYRELLIDELVDRLLEYASRIQALREETGWSAESPLPRSEQLWLDPLRDDAGFQHERADGEWREEIAKRFASWLNQQLRFKKLDVKDTEHMEWSSLVERKLASLKEDLEVMS